MVNIRLIIHSTSGPGYHNVEYHWLKEEELTQDVLDYLEEIEDGLVIDDGEFEPYLGKGARKFIRDIGTENSLFYSKAEALPYPRLMHIYTITETSY